ncbi:protein yellow-like [Maniola jurtina]|uniref:protein yellow-like n=1 Tax=Maniola jurtina TaxID=191418 RepID=UPI001E68FA62|nr:protein yellow-like [Maniola jurtina]
MAVSHQWFIQWSPPSLLFADINREYNNINPNWNYKQNYRSPYERPSTAVNEDYYYDDRPNYGKSNNKNNDYEAERSKVSDRTRAAGVTLWLTMLGLSHSQSVPTDTETLPLSTLYKWKHVDFEFPSERHRLYAIANGDFIPANVLPLGLEVWGSRVFVTLPSWKRGVPATLATVSRNGGVTSPRLKPYPDWSYHRAFSKSSNCSGLTSVFRMSVDPCGRLWVLDSGQIDSQDDPKQICPPSIIVFDLQTDLPISRYIIPKEYVKEDSLYSNIIVDTRMGDCSDLYVYIADTWRFGLLVFRESDESFWRFSHHLFYPDPLASNYTLHGLNFQWSDGIFGLALSPIDEHNERILFFHSMSSYREFFVKTSILRDSSRVNNSVTEFKLLGESRGLFGQSSASAIDNRGVMFYGLVTRDTIGCWDTRKPYLKRNTGVVAMNTETLIFPNDIKVDQEVRQSVWVISNRLPMFQAGPLDPNDYNYRIMYADTSEAVRGTVCDPNVLPVHSQTFNNWVK